MSSQNVSSLLYSYIDKLKHLNRMSVILFYFQAINDYTTKISKMTTDAEVSEEITTNNTFLNCN
jgi:hypothetical protein